jgi:hypothetical protein
MRRLSVACQLSIFCVIALCGGCAVVAVGNAAVAVGSAVVTTGAVVVTTGVKATGAVVNAVIP